MKSMVRIFVRHCNSFMSLVDITHQAVFIVRKNLIFGMRGCLSPSQQNLAKYKNTLASGNAGDEKNLHLAVANLFLKSV